VVNQSLSNIISELPTVNVMGAGGLGGSPGFPPGGLKPWVTFIVSLHFTWLLILLLPEGKFLNIIPAVAGMSAATSLARVDVLYIVVETRATTTGFGASRRFLDHRRETPEPFLLE